MTTTGSRRERQSSEFGVRKAKPPLKFWQVATSDR